MTKEYYCGIAIPSMCNEAGFVTAYQEAFGGPPYNETYSEDEVLDILHTHQRDGIAQIATSLDRIIGFGCALPFDKSPDDVKGFLEYLHQNGRLPKEFDFRSAWYMSELGVLNEYRGIGAAWELVWRRMLSISYRGGRQFFMRTAWPNSMSLPMYIKAGAEMLADIQDIQETKQATENNTQSLQRVYLWGDCMESARKIEQIKNEKGYIPFESDGDPELEAIRAGLVATRTAPNPVV